jgi:hypothetical protein
MIDMVTNLVKVVRIDNKIATHIALHSENTWSSRYPRQRSLKQTQVASECIKQCIGKSLQVLSTLHPAAGILDAQQLVDIAIANAVYATRVHSIVH